MRWDGSRDPGRNHEDTKKYEGHEEDFLYKKIFVIFVIFVSSWFRRDGRPVHGAGLPSTVIAVWRTNSTRRSRNHFPRATRPATRRRRESASTSRTRRMRTRRTMSTRPLGKLRIKNLEFGIRRPAVALTGRGTAVI